MADSGTPSHTSSRSARQKPVTRICGAILTHSPAEMPPSTPEPVEVLIRRCLSGDQSAWDLIVRQYWRKVFNVAYKFVGKHDEAEDLTQDIFLKIFKSLGT